MKSTYKLFGTVWDGIEENNQMIVDECEQQADTSTVLLSDFIRASDKDDVEKLLEPFCSSDTIIIDMDYHYEGKNPIMKTFVDKREWQIKTYLSKKFDFVYCCHSLKKKSRQVLPTPNGIRSEDTNIF